MTEGERFVDEDENPIPPKNTWDELSVNELIDVKTQLEDKLWTFGRQPMMGSVLAQALKEVNAMIASRTAG
jgi:hypothetical protein